MSRRPSCPEGVISLSQEREGVPYSVDGFRTPEAIPAPEHFLSRAAYLARPVPISSVLPLFTDCR